MLDLHTSLVLANSSVKMLANIHPCACDCTVVSVMQTFWEITHLIHSLHLSQTLKVIESINLSGFIRVCAVAADS